MNNPKITILLASYNRLELLKQSIDSCINQVGFYDYDILIIDDGSNLETQNWLREIEENNNRIKVYFSKNQGVGAARAKGLELAEGEFVMILDSDDLLIKSSLAIMNSYQIENEEIDFFYCNNLEIYPDTKNRVSNYPEYKDNRAFKRAIFCKPRVPFKHSGSTFRRNVALEIGGYDSSLRSKIDIDFIAKFLSIESVKFLLIKEPLVKFNFHKDSISRRKRITGLKVWWFIISKYGPKSFVGKFIYFMRRSFAELAKFAVEQIRLRSY